MLCRWGVTTHAPADFATVNYICRGHFPSVHSSSEETMANFPLPVRAVQVTVRFQPTAQPSNLSWGVMGGNGSFSTVWSFIAFANSLGEKILLPERGSGMKTFLRWSFFRNRKGAGIGWKFSDATVCLLLPGIKTNAQRFSASNSRPETRLVKWACRWFTRRRHFFESE